MAKSGMSSGAVSMASKLVADYAVPTSIVTAGSNDSLTLRGFLTTPSSTNNLRLHGSWNDASNFVEFPVSMVRWIDTRTETSGRPLDTTLYLDLATRLQFSNSSAKPLHTDLASLIYTLGRPQAMATLPVAVPVPPRRYAILAAATASATITNSPRRLSLAMSAIPLGPDGSPISIQYADDGTIASAFGISKKNVRYDLTSNTTIVKIKKTETAISQHYLVRTVKFSESSDSPLCISYLFSAAAENMRIFVGKDGILLGIDFDFHSSRMALGPALVTRTLSYQGVLYSEDKGAYDPNTNTCTLLLPLDMVLWPYIDRLDYFEPMLSGALTGAVDNLQQSASILSPQDAFHTFVNEIAKKDVLKLIGDTIIAGAAGFAAGFAAQSPQVGRWAAGVVWGLLGGATVWETMLWNYYVDSLPDDNPAGGGGPPDAGVSGGVGSGTNGGGTEPVKKQEVKSEDGASKSTN
jgi:hypothetical protein